MRPRWSQDTDDDVRWTDAELHIVVFGNYQLAEGSATHAHAGGIQPLRHQGSTKQQHAKLPDSIHQGAH